VQVEVRGLKFDVDVRAQNPMSGELTTLCANPLLSPSFGPVISVGSTKQAQ